MTTCEPLPDCTCGHDERAHFMTPSGRFACSVVTHGRTTRGIIGVAYSDRCRCENYTAPADASPADTAAENTGARPAPDQAREGQP